MTRILLIKASAICIGVFFALLISEVIFRLVGPQFSIVPVIYDNEVGALNQPGYSGVYSKEGFSHFSINSEGWRDIERKVEKEKDIYRIAVVGDSFIEGFQVEKESLLTSKLENMLNSVKSPLKYEVIPFGMSGLDAATALQAILHKVSKYNPDLIIYAFLSGNDLRDGLRELYNLPWKPYYIINENGSLELDTSFSKYILKTKRGIIRKTHVFLRGASDLYSYILYKVLPLTIEWISKTKSHIKPDNSKKKNVEQGAKEEPGLNKWEILKIAPSNSYKKAWNITERIILKMKEHCDSIKADFIVIGITNAFQVQFNKDLNITPGYDLFHPENHMESFSEKSNIHYLALAKKFQILHKEKGLIFHGTKENPGGHWNAIGHEYAAKFLAAFINEKRFLPK